MLEAAKPHKHMKTLRPTVNRLDLAKLARNDKYTTNVFWLIKNQYQPKFLKDISSKSDIPLETCEIAINKAEEGEIEELKIKRIVLEPTIEEWCNVPFIDLINSQDKVTRVNAYWYEMFKNLDCKPYQTQSFKYQPVIMKKNNKLIGMIMPIRFDWSI